MAVSLIFDRVEWIKGELLGHGEVYTLLSAILVISATEVVIPPVSVCLLTGLLKKLVIKLMKF